MPPSLIHLTHPLRRKYPPPGLSQMDPVRLCFASKVSISFLPHPAACIDGSFFFVPPNIIRAAREGNLDLVLGTGRMNINLESLARVHLSIIDSLQLLSCSSKNVVCCIPFFTEHHQDRYPRPRPRPRVTHESYSKCRS